MTAKHTALVLGATGLVGKALVTQLLNDNRYSQVTCLIRRPFAAADFEDKTNKLQPVVIDFEQLDDMQGYFAVDHVYVCLGTTIKKAGTKAAFRKIDFEYVHAAAQIASLQRVKSFVWISSVGANAKSGNFYLRVKGELENAIFAIPNLQNAFAVRPSLLLGERQESRVAEQLGILAGRIIAKLLIGRLEKYRPIDAQDVAHQMIGLHSFSK